MKESKYNDKLQMAIVRAGDTGLSPAEMQQATGCSRQYAYMWVTKNKDHLKAVGMSPQGAQRYSWRRQATTEDIEVGTQFIVTRIRWVGGRVLATIKAGEITMDVPLDKGETA